MSSASSTLDPKLYLPYVQCIIRMSYVIATMKTNALKLPDCCACLARACYLCDLCILFVQVVEVMHLGRIAAILEAYIVHAVQPLVFL